MPGVIPFRCQSVWHPGEGWPKPCAFFVERGGKVLLQRNFQQRNVQRSVANRTYTVPVRYQLMPLGCPDIFPGQPCPTCPPCPPCPCTPGLLTTAIYQYTTFSDGQKNSYTNADATPQLSTSGILGQQTVSIVNLFINGILQPPNSYAVQDGLLVLSEVPPQGVPIILQFIQIVTT